jgi:hypothetical protein
MNFIVATNIYSNLDLMKNNVNEIVNEASWEPYNQIGLTSRPGSKNKWYDAVGSRFDKNNLCYGANEADFTEFNVTSNYIHQELQNLKIKENIKLGRVRLMRLLPHRGLSVHKDTEIRYHYVIETNNCSYLCETNDNADNLQVKANCFHLPADGQWYKIDTTKTHWVYNGGKTPRIHLVVCVI